jgi:hypothetical protein
MMAILHAIATFAFFTSIPSISRTPLHDRNRAFERQRVLGRGRSKEPVPLLLFAGPWRGTRRRSRERSPQPGDRFKPIHTSPRKAFMES